ncbi:class I SAM-dependent methyltransferase [Lysinibacillus sp. FSL R7-0073]|uniref:class I SAM-dependent methyltransferase n=1 Tax=Lysinibacillus TaxID=400634 RepID=UPI00215A8934|nr:class I SAM-dependent methyltransferase [Lysinibacillus fusiformis]MCR8852569.1 class I SAM-dependent methyltransferase [Lysinibacillus fusiformis]MED4888317.1 class I SAM-dependent methyltransferase [Lysinibacillus fusiformis]
MLLNQQGFDLWADGYDQTVQLSEENQQYPFAGYKDILNKIFNEVMQVPASTVLDIGFGTGVLTAKLYEHGHKIDGFDFSSKMMAIAQAKMPQANLLEWDLSNGLPATLMNKQYDAIVSTYALHHFTDEQKVTYITQLLQQLTPNGKILIGDVAFQTREQLEQCRQDSKGYWDDDEFYFVHEELKTSLQDRCQLQFYPISHCGGVFVISNYTEVER